LVDNTVCSSKGSGRNSGLPRRRECAKLVRDAMDRDPNPLQLLSNFAFARIIEVLPSA
jgi:hypothetical protein